MGKLISTPPSLIQSPQSRRKVIKGLSLVGAGAFIAGCHQAGNPAADPPKAQVKEEEPPEGARDEPEVTATEDLMREHGILRRALLVYKESADKLRNNYNSVPPEALEKVAQLFRSFGEDYHEKKLEEAFIFPALKKNPGPATIYTDVLVAQHTRGREITEFVLATTAADKLASGVSRDLVTALDAFVRMYEHHAAIEDTIIFPAWKAGLKEGELDEIGARFEEIEQQQFGTDGFEAAAQRMSDIEQSLGLADLSQFTAPPPPPVRGTGK
jgi:hemerythrin-like domain-containing protein